MSSYNQIFFREITYMAITQTPYLCPSLAARLSKCPDSWVCSSSETPFSSLSTNLACGLVCLMLVLAVLLLLLCMYFMYSFKKLLLFSWFFSFFFFHLIIYLSVILYIKYMFLCMTFKFICESASSTFFCSVFLAMFKKKKRLVYCKWN